MGTIPLYARLLLAGLSSLALSGCFLVGLSEDIGQSSCESDTDCGGLEAEDSDPCMAWQCQPDSDRGGSDYCQYTRLDADHDGVLAASVVGPDDDAISCGDASEELDCDDDNPQRAPTLDETCDNVDNDCDERVDEGVLASTSNTAVLFTTNAVSRIDFATNEEAGTMAAVYVGSKGSEPGASMVALDTTEATGDSEIPLSGKYAFSPTPIAQDMAVAALDSDQFAVAYFDDAGSDRLVAGLLPRGDVTVNTRITVDEGVERWGLVCDGSEACAANALEPDVTVSHPPTGQLALAASGRSALLAYQRQPAQIAPACGVAPEDGDEPTVMVNLLSKPAARKVLVDSGPAPLVLGKSQEQHPPAVLALPEFEGVSGFLVAMTELGGAIVVHHVSPGEAGPVATRTGIVIEESLVSGTALGRPAIAITEAEDGSALLMVAYRAGCKTEATIEAQLFTLGGSGGAIQTELLAGPFTVGPENTADRPAVTYSVTLGLWAVSYRSPRGLHAQLLERDGTLRGDGSYLLLDSAPDDGDPQGFLQNPAVFPLDATNGWFGVASLVMNDSSEELSVALVRIDTCEM